MPSGFEQDNTLPAGSRTGSSLLAELASGITSLAPLSGGQNPGLFTGSRAEKDGLTIASPAANGQTVTPNPANIAANSPFMQLVTPEPR